MQKAGAKTTRPTVDLGGQIAFVTGAASGIGRQTARALAESGAMVFAADKAGAACIETCAAFPERMSYLACDVTSVSSVRAALDAVWQEHGALDILINCAGVYSMQQLMDVTEDEFDKVLNINLKGLFFVSQIAARYMIKVGGGGAIVNIASAAGRKPSIGSLVYSASKAGVINLTQGMAQELAPHKIRVNAIAPGAVETPMWDAVKSAYEKGDSESALSIEAALLAATPLGRLCRPQDCADAILYLCTDQSAFVTGQTLNVDGGMYFN
ncbi:SDR family oxidoreductase (plasmid) [Sphingobium sp. SJ10-10]|uniref:3-oxoacyl-[acyl-carrier protein] reductase n=1 Tax=Sphingomonas sp. NS2 TaxID=908605 RepID=A0A0D4ZZI3_9SPHN|nr:MULTISPECIES: SDR family oxidoreductase [unclassified Sphingobium]AJW29363.1 3-oxoacyl-[acyl-carrier protein] reductase [Sphingomonas sp. NS2]AMK26565.1 short-chain dehydrogenase/reductase SDR [Sphingobium sp. TKS]MEC6699585.1 SDR family oxidoreductase [Sphingobium sp. SJ10-10]NML91725.1 SDR family oxidoreductase [Sphingobium sp. TB-6]